MASDGAEGHGAHDPQLADRLGICQWFHFEAHDDLERAARLLDELGVRHLRTGISWADFHRPEGREWYDRQFAVLGELDLELLVSIWHTPPSIGESPRCAAPPRRLGDYAEFVALCCDLWPEAFAAVELWNEPNNRLKWDFEGHDPDWSKFGRMIGPAGVAARRRGKTTVLGGMIPVDASWLELVASHGALEGCDAVGIHGFPGMWWPDHPCWDWHDHWNGWADKVRTVHGVTPDRPVWITEAGLATWDPDRRRRGRYDLQVSWLREAAAAPAERVYWYSLVDLDPARMAIEGFHVEEAEYHLGLVDHRGERKPSWWAFAELLAEGPGEAAAGTRGGR